MGCNCKRTFNNMGKYADEDSSNGPDYNIFIRIIGYFLQICFGILVFCISIIILPIILIWFVGCIILRKNPTLDISKIINKKSKKRDE